MGSNFLYSTKNIRLFVIISRKKKKNCILRKNHGLLEAPAVMNVSVIIKWKFLIFLGILIGLSGIFQEFELLS